MMPQTQERINGAGDHHIKLIIQGMRTQATSILESADRLEEHLSASPAFKPEQQKPQVDYQHRDRAISQQLVNTMKKLYHLRSSDYLDRAIERHAREAELKPEELKRAFTYYCQKQATGLEARPF